MFNRLKQAGLVFISVCMFSCEPAKIHVEVVERPVVSSRNAHYVSNREPLQASKLIKLPVGSVKPEGWLLEYLHLQRDGLTGNLNKISAWLQKENNAWLSPEGKGEWGWEEVPYWLKGYANIGFILEDQEMIEEAKVWIEGVLKSQRNDGDFGPDFAWKSYVSNEDRVHEEKEILRDLWPNMIMLYCLQSYYEYSGDERVIKLMSNYFRFQLQIPDDEFLSKEHYWQRIRGGDNLHSVFWLYNRTGEEWLLELAEKIHRNTAPWSSRGHGLDAIGSYKAIREGMEWPAWYGDLIDWHNVNVAQAFREPAQYYLLSGDTADLQASYKNHHIVRRYFGQVPGGMFGSDENSRPGYDDPRQGIETCGMVEQMNSDEHLLRITGDIFWADHAEEVAFNTYPAAVNADFKSLRYITSPNMVLNDDKNHSPGIQNRGPFLMMNPFSSRCCQHNHTQGWPYFAENLWMATPDNGAAAVIYSASRVSIKVGDGTEVEIQEEGNYPFEESLSFTFATPKSLEFPFYLRIPGWASTARITINGKKVKVQTEAGTYVRITRKWSDKDVLTLDLPMKIELTNWEHNHHSVSVNYGPLTFSLKIGEHYLKKKSDETALRNSKWQKDVDTREWPSFEIHPTTAWNYGLILDKKKPETSFTVERKAWPEDNFPFTVASAPIVLKTKGRKIPEWTLGEYGLVGELCDSPVKSDEPDEIIELVPMGAARLRISSFPVIGEGQDARAWKSRMDEPK